VRRIIFAGMVLAVAVTAVRAADVKDSKAAAETRKKLDESLTVEWKEELFKNVLEELTEKTKVKFKLDLKGGVSQNRKISYAGKDKPLKDVLDKMLESQGWGYIVISNDKEVQFDGAVLVKVGKERGYPEGQEPAKTPAKPDATKPVVKDKPETKPKPDPKDEPKAKPEPKEKPPEPKEKPADDEDKTERAATLKFKLAKEFFNDGKVDKAKEVCEEILKKYPKAKAAEDAQKLLDKLNQS
jgi:hypothetical protein